MVTVRLRLECLLCGQRGYPPHWEESPQKKMNFLTDLHWHVLVNSERHFCFLVPILVLGLGLGLGSQVLGLGLGLGRQVLGLGLGLGSQVLGLGLGLDNQVLDNNTAYISLDPAVACIVHRH